jgi:hypothetical protein
LARSAAYFGHLGILLDRGKKIVPEILDAAAAGGRLHVVQYADQQLGVQATRRGLTDAVANGHEDAAHYLMHQQHMAPTLRDVEEACCLNNTRMVKDMLMALDTVVEKPCVDELGFGHLLALPGKSIRDKLTVPFFGYALDELECTTAHFIILHRSFYHEYMGCSLDEHVVCIAASYNRVDVFRVAARMLAPDGRLERRGLVWLKWAICRRAKDMIDELCKFIPDANARHLALGLAMDDRRFSPWIDPGSDYVEWFKTTYL